MLQKIEAFFAGNKVFVLGSLSAIGVALQQFLGSATVDYKVIGFAALIAVLSYLAKSLTGAVASIIGVIGSAVLTISQVASGGHVSWGQLILSTVVALIGVVTGAATSSKPTAAK